jgi:NAD(P)-dependent dehydrogenase (short-subunit alcohol dehydrogenase family)
MIGGPYNSYHPSLEGKVVIVTGANAGVGFNSAEELA